MDAGRVGFGNRVAEDRPTFRFSRRAVLTRGLGAAGIGVLVLTKGRCLLPGSSVSAQETSPPRLAVFPTHGCRSTSPGTEISFRNVPLELLDPVTVIGSETGKHSGVLLPHADGRGTSFLPDAPFQPAEAFAGTPAPWEATDGPLPYRVTAAPQPRAQPDTTPRSPQVRSSRTARRQVGVKSNR